MKPLETVINDMVEESGRKKSEIAADMGKPLSTLSREISPYDEGAKLGVADLLPLMNACGSVAPLEWLAAARGLRLVPIDGNQEGECVVEGIVLAHEAVADFLAKARTAHPCNVKLLGLRRRVAKKMDGVMTRVHGVRCGRS